MPARFISLVFLLLLFFFSISFAQKKEVVFYEILQDDSVRLFINNFFNFTERNCAAYTRDIRITQEGFLNGYFEDKGENGLLGRGTYINGGKHGYFEIFYPMGNIMCRGNYSGDQPSGDWEFFHENGMPDRILRIEGTDLAVLRLVDEKGTLLVDNGNGEFYGRVVGPSSSTNSLIARGKMVDGKPDGKWSADLHGKVYCREEFEHGKFIRGVLPNSKLTKSYNSEPNLTGFFLANYLQIVENFYIRECPRTEEVSFVMAYDFNMNAFSSDVRNKIGQVIDQDLRQGKRSDYGYGSNHMIIQFTVNEEGKADQFTMISGWGNQFYVPIVSSIRSRTKYRPSMGTLYFHMDISFTSDSMYSMSFRFSRDRNF